jgi:hypothetical protein
MRLEWLAKELAKLERMITGLIFSRTKRPEALPTKVVAWGISD